MKKKRVTFEDIAKYTNFSKTTISRYFNNPDSLTLENQEIIARALKELNYQENKVGRILASGKTEFVGIIIPDLYFHYYSEMLNQLLATYETYGYKFLVFAGSSHPDVERRYIRELLAYNIEGMIVLSHTISSEELASYGIPIVTIEREDRCTCSVNTDNYMGAVQACSLLYRNKCDVLIHINGDIAPEIPSRARINGFLDFCREHQIAHEWVLKDLSINYDETSKILLEVVDYLNQKYPVRKKGIFMPNDTHANVLLNVLVRKYGTLPPDYCIIGFDNSPISREAIIPTSTVGQQIETIAASAMELLVSRMNEQKKRKPSPLSEPIHRVIPPVLIPRETCNFAG